MNVTIIKAQTKSLSMLLLDCALTADSADSFSDIANKMVLQAFLDHEMMKVRFHAKKRENCGSSGRFHTKYPS